MMARKRKVQKTTLIEELAKRFLASIIALAKNENLDIEEVLKKVFGTTRISKDAKLFEKFELSNPEYYVIPVIVKKSNKDTVAQLLKLNSENITAYLNKLKSELLEPELEVEKLLDTVFCPMGLCNEEVLNEVEEMSEEDEDETTTAVTRRGGRSRRQSTSYDDEVVDKPKRRGRPPKRKQRSVDLNLGEEDIDTTDMDSEVSVPDYDEDLDQSEPEF